MNFTRQYPTIGPYACSLLHFEHSLYTPMSHKLHLRGQCGTAHVNSLFTRRIPSQTPWVGRPWPGSGCGHQRKSAFSIAHGGKETQPLSSPCPDGCKKEINEQHFATLSRCTWMVWHTRAWSSLLWTSKDNPSTREALGDRARLRNCCLMQHVGGLRTRPGMCRSCNRGALYWACSNASSYPVPHSHSFFFFFGHI